MCIRDRDKVNGSRRGDYRQYYDRALMDGVAELYRGDLERFGYCLLYTSRCV